MQGMFSDLVCILPLAVTGLSTEMAGARSTFLLVGAIGLALVVALELTRLRSCGRSCWKRRLPPG